MAQEIDINLNVNAEQADKSLGSLKSQLKQAQAEVQTLADKFGATSAEAVNAAKKAADLKDRIGDAKSLTDAFNPDAKFKSLSASLTGVAGGFAAYQGAMGLVGVESKDLEKQLLKVQSAMAIASGLNALGEAKDSFKQLGAAAMDALKGIKTGLAATGIGLLVIALGTIYAYWDDIKAAVSGVSAEQKKLNDVSQKNVDQANERLKAIGNQDNILKLQGKSEKEILNLKIKQTDEAISANRINQENQKVNTRLAVEGAERNLSLLKSYLNFVSLPLRYIYETYSNIINKVIDLMNKIPGIDIKYKIDEKLGDKAVDYLAKLAFDPAKVKSDGAAAVKESQNTIDKLLNDRAGYQLSINASEKKADKEKVLSESDKLEKLKKLTDEYNKKLREEDRQDPDAIDITGLENKAFIDAKFKEEELDRFRQHELAIADLMYNSIAERQKREDEENERKVQKYRETVEAVGSIAQSGENLLAALQANGLARNKAGQAVMKGLALVQIAADSAIAFSKMMQGTEASATGASLSVPPPAAPATYLATKVAFYASGSATILANLARARALLGSGGGGGATAATATTTAAPSFNIVGPSGANQIAESIGNKESQPLKAYVVGGDVTTQQSLNRGIVQNATLG